VKEARGQLDDLVRGLREVLGEGLVGVYLHGSLTLGCFNPALSDLDLLVVTKRPLTPTEREALGGLLAGSGRIEISVLPASSLRPWRHPAPYDLHFWWQAGRLVGPGEDADLAAHVTVLHHAGVALVGPPVADVFPNVPWEDYEDSLRRDLADSWSLEHGNRLYAVLSPARIWATLTDHAVHSKASGTAWALERAPEEFRPLLFRALDAYKSGNRQPVLDRKEVRGFADFVRDQLSGSQTLQ
jgi:predicted nucleotidyltransferase